MSTDLFTLITFLGSVLAGMLGALTGMGGGVIVIPLLTLGLGVDFHYAIGAALVSVIATSTGSAAAYVREGITNIRIGIFLEVATTIGAVLASVWLTTVLPKQSLAIIFGLVLVLSVFLNLRRRSSIKEVEHAGSLAARLRLNGSFVEQGQLRQYSVTNVAGGFLMMLVAGVISGLLGIGSGALKVLAMDNIMRIPFKVSTTTSNFMIGVTATASAVVYFQKGYILPGIAAPVMLGVLVGAMAGAKILVRLQTRWLRLGFSIVVTYLAIQMIYNGVSGKI
jgi:uncharacterized membrane protein YfcA